MAQRDQRLAFIAGSSRKPAHVRRVARILNGRLLDLLLIDGDHSFEGVKADFLAYRRFARDGGIIAFHDIVPDGSERGIHTGAYSGGVPQLWSLLRQVYPAQEFVHDRDHQFGFGIGAITYCSDVALDLEDSVRQWLDITPSSGLPSGGPVPPTPGPGTSRGRLTG